MAKEKAEAKAEAKVVKSITKSQFMTEIASQTGKTKKEAEEFFLAMTNVIVKQLSTKGPGAVTVPGLFKLKAKRVKAVKGGKLVPNRFKPGEMTVTKDKPAHTKVTARPMKTLKELLK